MLGWVKWVVIKEMPEITWAVCYKLAAFWAPAQNCPLLVSWQFSETYGGTNYGSGWRKDVVNQCLEFGTTAVHTEPAVNNRSIRLSLSCKTDSSVFYRSMVILKKKEKRATWLCEITITDNKNTVHASEIKYTAEMKHSCKQPYFQQSWVSKTAGVCLALRSNIFSFIHAAIKHISKNLWKGDFGDQNTFSHVDHVFSSLKPH